MTRMENKAAKFYITGMTCVSCKLFIEGKLHENGIKNSKVSLADNAIILQDADLTPEMLNKIFLQDGYVFSREKPDMKNELYGKLAGIAAALLFSAIFFLIVRAADPGALSNISKNPGFIAMIIYGLLAGFSTCAALVGSVMLALSKKWSENPDKKFLGRYSAPIYFNAGRIIMFSLLGGFLGMAGSALKFSPNLTALLVVGVSLILIFQGLKMLGFGLKIFRSNSQGIYKLLSSRFEGMQSSLKAFISGALTFLLPCGFTLTAVGLAVISGSFEQGLLVMLAFALGTLPSLLLIGLTSIHLYGNPRIGKNFSYSAGMLIIIFSFYSINSQLNVLGLPSLSPAGKPSTAGETRNSAIDSPLLPPIKDGKQVISMMATSRGYSPSAFTVRAGTPVRWEITDAGTSGCTNAVIAKGLFPGEISLRPGEVSIKEFTPQKPGRYKFSCWMGMITGTFDVVE